MSLVGYCVLDNFNKIVSGNDFNIKDIKSVKDDLLTYFNNNKKDIVNTINDKKVLDDELKVSIVENAREYLNGKHKGN